MAPSTMLRMVPLPCFAGEDHDRAARHLTSTILGRSDNDEGLV
jgi:hypothetical protein